MVVRSTVGVRVQLLDGGPITVNAGPPVTQIGDSFSDPGDSSFRIEADPSSDAVVLIVRGNE